MASRSLASSSFFFVLFSVLSAVICLVNNFAFEQPRVTLLFDSLHYFQTMQGMVDFAIHNLTGKDVYSPSQHLEFLHYVRLDGPVLAVILGAPFILLGKHPEIADSKTIMIMQCLIQGITAGLVWMLSFRLSNSRRASSFSCMLFVLYPPVSLQTQRLLTEPLALLFFTGFVCLATMRRMSMLYALLLGILAATVGLLKTALIVPVAVALMMRALVYRDGAKTSGFALAGFILGFLPWALFTHRQLGRLLLFADREPALNLALGFDLETGGLPATFRSPFCKLVFDLDHPVRSAVDLYASHPLQYLQLFFLKAIKLVAFPWNDFRHSFFGINATAQMLPHITILLLGVVGIAIFLSLPENRMSNCWRSAAVCLSVIAGHGVYILVQPNPRYMLTACPSLIAFLAFGLASFNRVSSARLKQIICLSAVLVAALYATDYATSFERSEKALTLHAGESLVRSLNLNREPALGLGSLFLIVDGNNLSSDTRVIVNGQRLDVPLTSIYRYDVDNERLASYQLMKTVSRYSGFPSSETFRQWRAVPVPFSMLKTGRNDFELYQASGEAQIYASSSTNPSSIASPERHLPTLEEWGVEQATIKPFNFDGRFENPVLCARQGEKEYCFWKNDAGAISAATKPVEGSPRIKLLFADSSFAKVADGSDRQAPVLLQSPHDAIFTSNPVGSCLLRLNENLLPEKYFVRLTGEAMRRGGGESASLQLFACDPHRAKRAADLPTRISPGSTWTEFLLDGSLDLKNVPVVEGFELQFFPKDQQLIENYGLKRGRSDTIFRNLKITLTRANLPHGTFSRYIIR